MKMKLSDLKDEPCRKYNSYILSTYGADGEFDPVEVFEGMSKDHTVHPTDVQWLISRHGSAWTEEMKSYYLGLNPTPFDLFGMLVFCKVARTDDVVEKFLAADPVEVEIDLLISYCRGMWMLKSLRPYLKGWRRLYCAVVDFFNSKA